MGTSNWQNIPWCVRAIMKIQPRRVLDVGVGFGRWGILIREFAEVWFDRVQTEDWSIRVEGIEAFEANIAPYHEHFYDHIYLGDAKEVLPTLDESWDLIIFGDVLEHFEKGDGEKLLELALARSDYVLVNIPIGDDWPQDDKYENPFEQHKATWEIDDFPQGLIRGQQHFVDFQERPFASLLLASTDPKDLALGLFGSPRQGEVELQPAGSWGAPEDRQTLEQIGERLEALQAIRESRAWQWLSRARNHRGIWSAASWFRGGGARIACSFSGPAREADEIRVLRIESDGRPVLWDFVGRNTAMALHADPAGAFGQALVARGPGARCWWNQYEGAPRLFVSGGPELGSMRLDTPAGRREVRLDRPAATVIAIDPLAAAPGPEDHPPVHPPPVRGSAPRVELGDTERATLENLRRDGGRCVALYVPNWIGIANATRVLCPVAHPMSAEVSAEERERLFALISEAGVEQVILSGGAVDHLRLTPELRRRWPDLRVKVLWHGSTLQVREDYAWRGLRLCFDLARRGVVDLLGFVKEGMAEFATDIGLPARFLLNYVPTVPEAPSQPHQRGPHFGMWISNEGWRKPPFAMAAAVRQVPGSCLHIAEDNKRLREFADLIGLPVQRHGGGLLSWPELARCMSGMHLNLYVTLSECCPMLPLESLSVGTPCLVGPTSHLFRDDRDLFDYLVVPFPDSEASILEKALRALAERDTIVEAYRRWATAYNERAVATAREFVEA